MEFRLISNLMCFQFKLGADMLLSDRCHFFIKNIRVASVFQHRETHIFWKWIFTKYQNASVDNLVLAVE